MMKKVIYCFLPLFLASMAAICFANDTSFQSGMDISGIILIALIVIGLLVFKIAFLISVYSAYQMIAKENRTCPMVVFVLLLILFPLLNLILFLPNSLRNQFKASERVEQLSDSLMLWGALTLILPIIAALVYWVKLVNFKKEQYRVT